MDPEAEWVAGGGESGLEEPMWQLSLGGGGAESYPERPDEPDCIYYLRTGFCGYGDRCRFNHPRDRSMAIGALRATGVEYPERAGQPACQYYMRTGMCKFGASCKYHHPKHGVGSSDSVTLNIYGYPLRPGENECSYYLKTGQCKFGATCKFDHPQPAGIQEQAPYPASGPLTAQAPAVYPTMQSPSVQSSQQYGVIPGNWPVARPTMLPGSYVPGSYGHMFLPPGVVPGWTPYQGPASPMASQSAQPTIGAGSIYGLTQLSSSATTYTGPYLSITSMGPSSSSEKEHAFPERPGQPECQYYLRTGDCKFGSTCKYHHPPEWGAPKTNIVLSPMGLPLRPICGAHPISFVPPGQGVHLRTSNEYPITFLRGAPLCSHYAQNGVCRFGPSCKFDHPMRSLSYSTSASSLTDMPVAPYPIGSTNATLAPSSSSSDLRPELLSGFSKDTFSSHMSSTNTSSAQPSGQGLTSSSSGSSISHGGEIRTSN